VGPNTHQGAPGASGAPWCLVGPRASSGATLGPLGCLLGRKKSPESFAAFGLRLIWIFCEVKNKQKTELALCIMSVG